MKKFAKDFLLGAATAAHQVEGNNINSDYWIQENIPHSMFEERSGEAVDHYHRFEEDIAMMSEAGLNSYRFSVEWARIQPEKDVWNQEEIEHYRLVILACKKHNIEPIITLHHFSSPQWVVKNGGWENPEIVTWFTAYCERVIQEVGDMVTYVCTINEANMRLQLAALIKDMRKRMETQALEKAAKEVEGGVQVGMNTNQQNMMLSMMETAQAFGIQDPTKVHTFLSQCTPEGDLLVMKAHEAARDSMKKSHPHIKVGITLSLHDIQPYEGGEEIAKKEWEEEFIHYLPYIRQDDFLGVQCYTRKRFSERGVEKPTEGMKRTQMGYEDYPVAIGNVVRRVAKDFHGDLIVTENGLATEDDGRRCEFIHEALESIQSCIEDGIPLKGYMYWSLLDNFEWQKGFGMTFGLIAVDRTTQQRTAKESLGVLGSYLPSL